MKVEPLMTPMAIDFFCKRLAGCSFAPRHSTAAECRAFNIELPPRLRFRRGWRPRHVAVHLLSVRERREKMSKIVKPRQQLWA